MVDRSDLEAGACECYAVVKKEILRLLSDVRYRASVTVMPQIEAFGGFIVSLVNGSASSQSATAARCQ